MYMRGKRRKTKVYMDFQHEVRDELLGIEWPFQSNPVEVFFSVGLSARQADLDNIFKPLLDTFQVVYDDFNDNKVYKITGHKLIVPKGDEFIRIRFSETTEQKVREQSGEAEQT